MIHSIQTLQMALVGYASQLENIRRQMAIIQAQIDGKPAAAVKEAASLPGWALGEYQGKPRRRRTMSAAARKRIAAAQRKRWAAFRRKRQHAGR